jgi:beta-lactamase class A
MLSKNKISKAMDKYQDYISYGFFRDDKIIEGKNTNVFFPSASIIKVFLLYYVLKNTERFSEYLELSNLKVTDDSLLIFFINQKIPLDASLSLMIDVSDNSVANYIVDTVGMESLNLFFWEEGFKRTKLERKFLDFEAQKKGLENTTSVEDIVLLLYKVLIANSLKPAEKSLFDSIMKKQFDRSKCNLYLPESLQTGGKSGTLDNVWNDFIYFTHNNELVIICFLTHNLPLFLSRELVSSYTYHIVNDILGHSLL